MQIIRKQYMLLLKQLLLYLILLFNAGMLNINTIRPETVINRSFDKNWQPYLQTPSFPEYSCGHCTLSSSAAEVLTSIFRDNFAYTDTSELEFGIKSRSYKSFRDAAEENDKARFYG